MITKFKLYENKLSIESLFINWDNPDYVKRWIDEGGDVNIIDDQGWTLLTLAANNQSSLMIKYLLKNGADVNLQNNNGNTASILVNTYYDIEILIDNGADLFIKNNQGKNTLDYLEDDNSYTSDTILKILEFNHPDIWKKHTTTKKANEFNL